MDLVKGVCLKRVAEFGGSTGRVAGASSLRISGAIQVLEEMPREESSPAPEDLEHPENLVEERTDLENVSGPDYIPRGELTSVAPVCEHCPANKVGLCSFGRSEPVRP